ncbi:MAG: hypothetical protein ACYSTT_24980, partial [Planctomycetota bacterium]
RSSFGRKAINLLSWCFAPTKVKQVNDRPPVGHMSVFNGLRQLVSDIGGHFYQKKESWQNS